MKFTGSKISANQDPDDPISGKRNFYMNENYLGPFFYKYTGKEKVFISSQKLRNVPFARRLMSITWISDWVELA